MIVSVQGKLYRVESSVKVTVTKGSPFIKAKLKDLETNKTVEKNFKPNQTIEDVALKNRHSNFFILKGRITFFSI